jgi:hypothetical protein
MKIFENLCIGALYLYLAISLVGIAKRDDSDHTDGTRSGMTPKTDYKTGCQYLQSPFGFSITPRMGANGKQLGCKEQA